MYSTQKFPAISTAEDVCGTPDQPQTLIDSSGHLANRLDDIAGRLDRILLRVEGDDQEVSPEQNRPMHYGLAPALRMAHDHAYRIESMIRVLEEKLG